MAVTSKPANQPYVLGPSESAAFWYVTPFLPPA
jgi:hypothetical protein